MTDARAAFERILSSPTEVETDDVDAVRAVLDRDPTSFTRSRNILPGFEPKPLSGFAACTTCGAHVTGEMQLRHAAWHEQRSST